jgi:hypothetical protein
MSVVLPCVSGVGIPHHRLFPGARLVTGWRRTRSADPCPDSRTPAARAQRLDGAPPMRDSSDQGVGAHPGPVVGDQGQERPFDSVRRRPAATRRLVRDSGNPHRCAPGTRDLPLSESTLREAQTRRRPRCAYSAAAVVGDSTWTTNDAPASADSAWVGVWLATSVSGLMSMRQPVSRAARRAF